MDRMQVPAGKSTPAVLLDAEQGVFEFSGESYPENSFEFYAPILAWIRAHLAGTGVRFDLRCALSYMNTSSTKCMMDILDIMEEAGRQGAQVSIRWMFDRDNDRGLEIAQELMEDYTIRCDYELT